MHQTLTCLKSINRFYEDIYISNGLSGDDVLKVSDIDKIQKQYENVTEKIISLREEVSESRNDTETEYVSVEDVLDTQETPSN